MSIMESLKTWWWRQRRRGKTLTIGPNWNQFPKLGPDGQVTIDCIIRAASYALPEHTSSNEHFDNAITGVSSHCVGAMLVEVDQYGFRLRWKAIQKPETLFPCSLNRPAKNPSATQPQQERRDHAATHFSDQ